MDRFFTFNRYLRQIFKERVHRLSLDAGFSCPNIDGSLSEEGCIYCNNKGFVPFARLNKSLGEQIGDSIKFYRHRLGVKKFIAYFQGYTNTYADQNRLREKYNIIRNFPEIVGLFISTRPDCVNEEKLKLIAGYKKDYLVWVEYGLQTTHNRPLKIINRNHTYEDFLAALNLTRKLGINVGVHLILGLPSSTYEEIMEDAQRLAKLDIQGIKFHILHVLKDTKLEKIYKEGGAVLLTKLEYIKTICDFLERIPSSLVILRLLSTASPRYLVAPLWINRKEEVIEGITRELEKRQSYQGYLCQN